MLGGVWMNSDGVVTSQIIQPKKICIEGKHEGHFFENVLGEIVDKGYLSESTLQRIQVEVINLWTEQIERYNRGRSSSIAENKAKSLLESIYVTLGFSLKELENLDDSILVLQKETIKTLFEKGQKALKKRFAQLKEQYAYLKEHLLETDNMAYRDTYDKGIEPFFVNYNIEFASQECPCDIDYPLSNDRMEAIGMEAMINYIERSLIEHKLCLKYDKEDIQAVLRGYHSGYKDLLINIFELVLMNAVGRQLIGKNLERLRLEVEEVEEIERILEILPDSILENKMIESGMKVLEAWKIDEVETKAYTIQTLHKFIPRIIVALEEENLDTIFIVTEQDNENKMHYKGGKRLEDEAFKTLTEEIRACEKVEDKIAWIRKEIQHVEDLRDLLEADCLFGEEYERLYESLEEIELAILLNIEKVDENDIAEVDIDEEWFIRLVNYLKTLDVEKQERVRDLTKTFVSYEK